MITAQPFLPCVCPDEAHARADCPRRAVPATRRTLVEAPRFRLLNPLYPGADSTGRRFALLEIE